MRQFIDFVLSNYYPAHSHLLTEFAPDFCDRSIRPEHEAQLLHYLRSTKIEVGLILNFGRKPEFKRKAYDTDRDNIENRQIY